MRSPGRIPVLMWAPPPLLFVISFLVGMGVQRLAPLTIHSPGAIRASQLIGVGLFACGALLVLSCLALFLSARTTVIPMGTASKLVTRGPYSFTRNPMYLSMTLMYLGVVGMLVQPWSLLLLLVPLVILNSVVIPFEEERLRSVFGEAFDAYRARVRRWV